jgi:SAM-dependent methyltransferase
MSPSTFVRSLGRAGMSLWSKLPPSILELRSFRALGRFIHKAVCRYSVREQGGSTWFLRNAPLLGAIAEQVRDMQLDRAVRICDIACCTGAEVYSVLYMIRSGCPHISLSMVAGDISADAIARAQAGQYRLSSAELRRPLPDQTLSELFERDGENLTVKAPLQQGIRWLVGDARDPSLAESLGSQDVVIANNFMVHMNDREAALCMRNLARLVRPGGFFVCRGVNLDIRERIAAQLGFCPLLPHLEEIHNADENLDARKDWPWRYWSLEPIDKSRKNWPMRYAAIFQAPPAAQPH